MNTTLDKPQSYDFELDFLFEYSSKKIDKKPNFSLLSQHVSIQWIKKTRELEFAILEQDSL